MRLLPLLLPLLLAACAAGEDQVTAITLGGASYQVPDAHIRSSTEEPHQFVRIKPPERSFELIYDSRTAGQTDRFGFPVIFSLNDEKAPNIDRHVRGDFMVVCRQAVNPRGGCGLKVSHGGAEWAVLFPNAQSDAANAIREQALATLAAYEA
jgi:hypothetical protein